MSDGPPCPGCIFKLWPCLCFAEATGHPAFCAHQTHRAKRWGPVIYRLTMGRPPGDETAPGTDPAQSRCCGQSDPAEFFGDKPIAAP